MGLDRRTWKNAAIAMLGLLALSTMAAADCSGDPANRLLSCGFSSAADTVDGTSPWDLPSPSPDNFGTYSWDSVAGSSAAGSLLAATTSDAGTGVVNFSQCVASPPNGTYGAGIDINYNPLDANFVQCDLAVLSYVATNCTGTATSLADPFTSTFDGSFHQLSVAGILVSGVGSIRVQAHCFKSLGSGSFRFDDAFFGIGSSPVELLSFSVS